MATQGCLSTLLPCFLLEMQEWPSAQGCLVKAGSWSSRFSKAGKAWAEGYTQGKTPARSPRGQGAPTELLCVLIFCSVLARGPGDRRGLPGLP